MVVLVERVRVVVRDPDFYKIVDTMAKRGRVERAYGFLSSKL